MTASLGKIRYTNICHITATSRINACLSPACLSYPIAAMPMMHLSAQNSLQYWLTVDGCIPGQDTIYQHLSYYCYHSYQCLSVPGMTLLSYHSKANDASVSWEHDPPILIDCRWMHPWARYDIPTSVILLLQLISMLVSPRHDSPIAAMPMMHLSAESNIQI